MIKSNIGDIVPAPAAANGSIRHRNVVCEHFVPPDQAWIHIPICSLGTPKPKQDSLKVARRRPCDAVVEMIEATLEREILGIGAVLGRFGPNASQVPRFCGRAHLKHSRFRRPLRGMHRQPVCLQTRHR